MTEPISLPEGYESTLTCYMIHEEEGFELVASINSTACVLLVKPDFKEEEIKAAFLNYASVPTEYGPEQWRFMTRQEIAEYKARKELEEEEAEYEY